MKTTLNTEDYNELVRMLIKVTESLELIGKSTGNEMPLTIGDAKKVIKKHIF